MAHLFTLIGSTGFRQTGLRPALRKKDSRSAPFSGPSQQMYRTVFFHPNSIKKKIKKRFLLSKEHGIIFECYEKHTT